MAVFFWACAVCIALALLLAFVGWAIYAPIVARAFAEMPWFPTRRTAITADDYPEGIFDAEKVSFDTADGLRLAGSYLPATAARRKGIVIFCHELRGDQTTALAFTSGLRDAGFDVLAFDFRNHGESAPNGMHRLLPWATVGEAADIQAAIDFCCRREGGGAGPIMLFGLSRGASAALCVAASDRRVRAAVLDSLCPTEPVQLFLIRRFMHLHVRALPQLARLPDWMFTMLAFWANQIIQRKHGCRLLHCDRAARRLRTPVLLIHGGRDGFAPLDVICGFRKRMRSRPRLWVVPEARHNETVFEAGEEYRDRVVRFLARHADASPDVHRLPAKPLATSLLPADNNPCDAEPVAV